MKAFVLILILNGEPIVMQDYDTQAACTDDLASIRAATLAADAAAYRCLTAAQFKTATDLYNKKLLETYRRDGNQ
jgi:hypothetical protein